MVKKLVLLLISLVAVYGYANTLYQTGQQVGIFSTQTPNHILQGTHQPGRMLDIEVKFEQQFTTIPKVAIANSLMDLEIGTQAGYSAEVINVSEKGFVIRVTALTEQSINSLAYNWFATNDPKIHIQYIETQQLGQLRQPGMDRIHTVNLPILLWDNEEKPLVVSFLIGAQLEGQEISLKQQVTDVTRTHIDITLNSSGDCAVKFVKLCLVFSSIEESFKTGQLGLNVEPNHPWLIRDQYSESNAETTFDIPSDITNRKSFFGFTSFEAPKQQGSLRLELGLMREQGEQAQLDYGTWGNSKIKELGFEAFFVGVETQKIFDQNCAEVFSKCNYEGEGQLICGSVDSFKGSVKSIHLPKGAVLTLYNEVKQQGEKILYLESVDCIENDAKMTNFLKTQGQSEAEGEGDSVNEEEGVLVVLGEEEGIAIGLADEEGVTFSEEGAYITSEASKQLYEEGYDFSEGELFSYYEESEGYSTLDDELELPTLDQGVLTEDS